MERGPGSFIKNEEGGLEENLEDPVMKNRKEIREKKEKEKKKKEAGKKERPSDEHEAKADIIAAMKEVIDIGEDLISGGRPDVKAVEAILGYQISAPERNDLMEVFSDVS